MSRQSVRTRAKTAAAATWTATRAIGRFLAGEAQSVTLLIGLLLLGGGLWEVFSSGVALIVVGVLVVWYAMPARPPFIDKVIQPVALPGKRAA